MPRNIILKIIKIIYLKKCQSPKPAEMAENGLLLGLEGQIITPFSQFFADHFKICQETSC